MLRTVHIGNFAYPDKQNVYSLKSYAKFYNELAQGSTSKVTVFAGYIGPGETGFDFSYEEKLSNEIDFVLSKGNTPTTDILPFIWNNLVLFTRLTLFSFRKADYFVFLPSPIGVWSTLLVSLLKRKHTLGIYLGGYYGLEQCFEKRNGLLKKTIKKVAANVVERLVLYSIRKADYIITPSYELYHSFSSSGKIFLTPPLMNVEEQDLELSFPGKDIKYITFCGELRHAKGVVDLLKAFALLIQEERVTGCRLKIIGSGQAADELQILAEENNIESLVEFCGQIKSREQLKEAIGKSTIFVLPSYSEGFPRVAYECFTLGVPTILTPVGGIPYLVKDKIHCLFTQPGNIQDLASKIEMLIKDQDMQTQLIQNAKQLMIDSIFPRVKEDISLAKLITKKKSNLSTA